MPVNIPIDRLSEYANKRGCPTGYLLSNEKYEDLRVHADGDVPVKLIECRRPSETEHIKEYRVKIYTPQTKTTISKVISSLSKIRRSPDWAINFPNTRPSAIAEDESLQKYTEERFPKSFVSLTNWMFSVCLKQYLLDANAVIMVRPLVYDVEANEYIKPFPFVFNSPQVLDFEDEQYAVLVSEKRCEYSVTDKSGKVLRTRGDGLILYVVDDTSIKVYEQINEAYGLRLSGRYEHNLGFMPAFKMPGQFFSTINENVLNESRISGMLAGLNEAARIYSDLQAEIVQHVHSQPWQYTNLDCDECEGTGHMQISEAEHTSCPKCKGGGKISVSPFDVMVITPPSVIDGTGAIPTPPAGYIQKTDVALMVDKLNALVNEQNYKALSAINMQFLDQVPVTQSGIAKEVDKEELNNFVHSIAEDLVMIMDKIMFMISEYRYSVVVPDAKNRKKLLPKIVVPSVFDLLSSSYLLDEIKKAKDANMNPLIIEALEAEYAAKKFYANPEISQVVSLSFQLDPMAGATDDQKMMRLQNNGVTQIDYILSSNLVSFLRRAIKEDPRFVSKSPEEQNAVLYGFAQEKQKQMDTREQVMPDPNEEEVILPVTPDNENPDEE